MADSTNGAPEKATSLRDFIYKSIEGRGCSDDEGLLEPQLADNLALILTDHVDSKIAIDRSKLAFVLGDTGCGYWRMYFLYDGKTVLRGDLEGEKKEALNGLFKAAARKVSELLEPNA